MTLDFATEYAQKVASGEIIASRKNIKVAQRHLKDIREGVDGYTFDTQRANKVIKFIEMLPDPKTGRPMPLMLFQKFIVASLYGWVDAEGNRRFTKAYISTARKNGKSLISSGIALFELFFGREPHHGREIYISSLTLKQAQTIYNMAYRQLSLLSQQSASLRRSIILRKTDIQHKGSDSKLMALSNNPDAIDGKNPSTVLLDELASMPDAEMYSRLKTGMGLQKNPLTVLISTASDNLNNPMYEEYEYITKLLAGEIQNENYFVFCAEQDSVEEVNDESLWIKSMPLLENEYHRDTILSNIKQDITEQREKGDESNILIKNFNIWQSSSSETYIGEKHWQACSIKEKPDIKGTDTYVSVDLARMNDISCFSFIHILEDGKQYADTHGFISNLTSVEAKSKKDKIDYQKLIDEGVVTLSDSESGIISYKQMIKWLMKYEKDNDLNIKYLTYDSWDVDSFIQEAINLGAKWNALEIGQGFKAISPSTKQFRYAVYNKKIVHDNNPLLNLALRNARVKEWEGNIKIDKNKQREKIDPIVALIGAYSESRHHEYKPKSISQKIAEGKLGF